jgi:hypothetical protein
MSIYSDYSYVKYFQNVKAPQNFVQSLHIHIALFLLVNKNIRKSWKTISICMWYLITYFCIYSSEKCGISSMVLLTLDIRSWRDYNVYPLSHYIICQIVNTLSFGTCFSLVVLTRRISWFIFLPFILKNHRVKSFKRYRVCFFDIKCIFMHCNVNAHFMNIDI